MTSSPEGGSGATVLERRGLPKSKWVRAEMAGVLLVLVLTAVPVGWCGRRDFNEALTFTGRMTGAALMVVALIMFLGVAAVVDYWVRGPTSNLGVVALISAGVALLTNALLLVQTWSDGEKVRYPVLFGVLTVGSVLAVVVVWRTLDEIPAPKRVAAALIVSTVLGVGNFSYQNLYQPYRRGAKPLVYLTVGKAVLSKDRKAFAVPVDIKLENHSDVGFYVLGTEFHAMGEQAPLSGRDRLHTQWRADAEHWSKYREKLPLSRREAYQPGQLVAAQPWIAPGNWIEANDESIARTVIQLPIDTPYDHLAFYATASLARKDRLGLGRSDPIGYSWRGAKLPQWVKDLGKGDDSIVYRSDVRENNAIDSYTRKARCVTVYWRFGVHGVEVSESITRRGEANRVTTESEDRDARGRYGLVDVLAGPIEQTLWGIKSQR
ncbi:hypothetical protein [Streptomyces sp. NPDC020362]|uniref:hypothetical protein n=1 Tax=unclassified Streptomyces TaxID=2593676 RepID=UPI000AA7AC36